MQICEEQLGFDTSGHSSFGQAAIAVANDTGLETQDGIYDFEDSDGKTALLVEGARRVGKSTVVEEFAKREYESYILIDFATASQLVKDLFKDVSDLNYP